MIVIGPQSYVQIPRLPTSQSINFQASSSFNEFDFNFNTISLTEEHAEASSACHDEDLINLKELSNNNNTATTTGKDIPGPVPGPGDLSTHDTPVRGASPELVRESSIGQICSKMSSKVPFRPFSAPQLSRNTSVDSLRAQINSRFMHSSAMSERSHSFCHKDDQALLHVHDDVHMESTWKNSHHLGTSFLSFVDTLKDRGDFKGTNRIRRGGRTAGASFHYPLPSDHPSIKKLETFAKNVACIVDGNDLVRLQS